MAENTEQATAVETEQAGSQEAVLGNIFSEALQGKEATPTDSVQAEEQAPAKEQEQQVAPPFLELLVGDKKVAFKDEEAFEDFLERNQILKDGWLRRSDYTQKTQELSQKQQELENKLKAEAEGWTHPLDPGSKKVFQTAWNLYQTTPDPLIAQSIEAFFQDINLLASGREALGPLKIGSVAGQAQIGAPSPEIVELRRQLALQGQQLKQFTSQMTAKEQQTLQQQQSERAARDEATVSTWIQEKEKAGSKIPPDELQTMANLYREDETGKPLFTLDQLHVMAQANLGRLTAQAKKDVLKDAKQLGKHTPKPPVSRGSSAQEPEPKGIGDIFKQGIKEMAS